MSASLGARGLAPGESGEERFFRADRAALAPRPLAPSGGDLLAAANAAAKLVERHILEPEWSNKRAENIVATTAAVASVEPAAARAVVCTLALRNPRMHELPPEIAAETALRILVSVGGLRGATLWSPAGGRRMARLAGNADEPPVTMARTAARACVTDGAVQRSVERRLVAVPVVHCGRAVAALVLSHERGQQRLARELGEEAAGALAIVLQRDLLFAGVAERARQLAEAGERRLARLAFDIHDGPLQNLAALGLELSALRSQLPDVLGDRPESRTTSERLEAVHADLASLESELRDLSGSLEPTGIARRPLADTLGHELAVAEARDGVRTTLRVSGDASETTPSQRIALTRVVQEALRNAVDHGRARTVDVRLEARRTGVYAEMHDDGCGFDVDRDLAIAARRGRLGVVGMSERIRLLGGVFAIESRVGGPTVVTVHLPWWRPLAADAETQRAARKSA